MYHILLDVLFFTVNITSGFEQILHEIQLIKYSFVFQNILTKIYEHILTCWESTKNIEIKRSR